MRQIEEMEQKEETAQAGPCSTQLEGRVGHGNEEVGEKRLSREACNAGDEGIGQGLRGEGGGAGPRPKKATRPKRSSMETTWAAGRAFARTTAQEKAASNAAGRASVRTTVKGAGANASFVDDRQQHGATLCVLASCRGLAISLSAQQYD